MPTDLPDLTHQWRQPDPLRHPRWWECSVPGCLCGTLGAPPSTLCPALVLRWGAEQRAAGAAEERAAVVAWLRPTDGGQPCAANYANAIEAGDHLEVSDVR